MSWQDILEKGDEEDNISKIRLPFGRKNKQNSNEEVKSRFQQSIKYAQNFNDLINAMETLSRNPSGEDIWNEGGARNSLKDAIIIGKAAISQEQVLPNDRRQYLAMIRAGYYDNALNDAAEMEKLYLTHVRDLRLSFSRAFGIRDMYKAFVSADTKEIRGVFDNTVQKRKAELQAKKQPQQATLDQFNTPPPQQPQQPQQPQEQRQTTLGEFGKMDWFESLKAHCATEKSNPMDRVTTTTSTGQDEEAAKRTKDDEKELLARILERNKKARES